MAGAIPTLAFRHLPAWIRMHLLALAIAFMALGGPAAHIAATDTRRRSSPIAKIRQQAQDKTTPRDAPERQQLSPHMIKLKPACSTSAA
ncbi:hypothetical protein LGM43_37145 [Burkholderia seminalis]|uniref:hypothetical protein n=1 Tax=Burkholderia seminalis TaxID=488731 RepID=UPI001CF432C0|nr:hypothetical protein [Burkholderia seminalis]MCA7955844.1 hypothetical protein [Burkholderia seminalis]